MVSVLRTSIFSLIFSTSFLCGMQNWTWLYKKIFSSEEITNNASKKRLFFAKENVPLFTQLIFSWNAIRPTIGSFIFFIQVQDQNGSWLPWFKMFEWGANIQKSYMEESADASYLYVRLEMQRGHKARGFRIKIQATQGADLSLLKFLAVSISNMPAFEEETVTNTQLSLPSVLIKNVPRISQKIVAHPKTDVICSPTSMTMLTSFLMHKPIDPVHFADSVLDTGLSIYGSWPFNVAHAFEVCDGTFFFATQRLNSFFELYRRLTLGIPVVVSIRGYLPGAAKVMPHGHLLVVVGWDQASGTVICNDPAFESNEATRKKYALESFLRAWERSKRLAYIAEPASPMEK